MFELSTPHRVAALRVLHPAATTSTIPSGLSRGFGRITYHPWD